MPEEGAGGLQAGPGQVGRERAAILGQSSQLCCLHRLAEAPRSTHGP